MKSRARWREEVKGEKQKGRREGKNTFFENQSKHPRDPTLGCCGRQLLRQQIFASWLINGDPRGLSHVIISKLLLSSLWAEALPSTHAVTQGSVFFPEETKGCYKGSTAPIWPPTPGSQAKFQTLHPQGTLGTSAQGQRRTVALLL